MRICEYPNCGRKTKNQYQGGKTCGYHKNWTNNSTSDLFKKKKELLAQLEEVEDEINFLKKDQNITLDGWQARSQHVPERYGPERIEFSKNEMIDLLGEPNSEDDESKTTMAWDIWHDDDGVHIYDFKQYGAGNEETITWSVQGTSQEAVENFRDIISAKKNS